MTDGANQHPWVAQVIADRDLEWLHNPSASIFKAPLTQKVRLWWGSGKPILVIDKGADVESDTIKSEGVQTPATTTGSTQNMQLSAPESTQATSFIGALTSGPTETAGEFFTPPTTVIDTLVQTDATDENLSTDDGAARSMTRDTNALGAIGGNRGRGQIYPDGSKSNNTVYNATAAGIVSKIIRKEKGGYEITITDASEGRQVVDIIPPGPELLVSEGESIKFDQPLTSNPNIGGFGQGDAEIVLQDPLRVQGLLFFLASVILAQIFLVLKKKQFEKVQLAEMNF
ncbi:Cytochrome f [Capsicum annuum]|uniref:Cytochrome f n=1 Tax=Capsicum annuum TaxID=4072 RepID=A0A2G3AIV3_CAPAN|nr:Cytochrome f [Capsicum annuum]